MVEMERSADREKAPTAWDSVSLDIWIVLICAFYVCLCSLNVGAYLANEVNSRNAPYFSPVGNGGAAALWGVAAIIPLTLMAVKIIRIRTVLKEPFDRNVARIKRNVDALTLASFTFVLLFTAVVKFFTPRALSW